MLGNSQVLVSGTLFKCEKYDEMVDIMDHVLEEMYQLYSEAL